MKTKILTGLLAVSLIVNLAMVTIPIVTDRYIMAITVLMSNNVRLLDCYRENGKLPGSLSVVNDGDGISSEIPVSYERQDENHATMRVYEKQWLPFMTTYVGGEVDMTQSQRSEWLHTPRAVGVGK